MPKNQLLASQGDKSSITLDVNKHSTAERQKRAMSAEDEMFKPM